jgi:hypothetical protein
MVMIAHVWSMALVQGFVRTNHHFVRLSLRQTVVALHRCAASRPPFASYNDVGSKKEEYSGDYADSDTGDYTTTRLEFFCNLWQILPTNYP